MNKYALYIKEREGSEYYENECGFFTYKVLGNIFQVDDVFILSEYRRNGEGNKLARIIENVAKEYNCKKIYCTTCIDANNWQISEKYILANGYTKEYKIATMNYYRKDI